MRFLYLPVDTFKSRKITFNKSHKAPLKIELTLNLAQADITGNYISSCQYLLPLILMCFSEMIKTAH